MSRTVQTTRSLAATLIGSLLLPLIAMAAVPEGEELIKLEKQRCPKPAELAIVFSFGYAGDSMPKDDARFEELLKKIKPAGFNVIHCTYTETRLALCKKHGLKMMIHLLAVEEHHIYKSPDKAKAVCEKLRKDPDVWGYNIWNDTFAKTGEGRRRDVNTVRQWDPTHPAFSGTYRTIGMHHLGNADIFGYYDFAWKRSPALHFPHLLTYLGWARERDAWFYRWIETDAGRKGAGNFNRSLYTVNTSLACGLKGILWFLGTSLMDAQTLEWTEAGRDITKVNLEILPLAREIARIGVPAAIHSTPISRTANNAPLPEGKKEMPPGLANNAFPKDFWVQPSGGEFVMGVFPEEGKKDALFVANHNAYAPQDVVLELKAPIKSVELFQRKKGEWEAVVGNSVKLKLDPAGGELLRIRRE